MTHAVVSVDPELPLAEVSKLMLGRGISAVCVVGHEGKLIGIVSEGDLLRRAELKTEKKRSWWLRIVSGDDELASEYVKCRGRKARDVMSPTPVTVSEDTPAVDIVAVLERHRIKRVPVVRDGRVVGIVSRANLLRAFAAEATREPPDVSTEDRAVRKRLLDELGNQPWWHGRKEEVIVADGIAHLWGIVHSDLERHALSVAAENTPGIKAVRNHVTVSSPMTLYTS
ncbi:MAG TPA: CBS domain-containing protein, partial [Burkholderiales bacterium]|nr:CBS domain-containing protein [Burkholderiales bacterium]